MITVHTIENDHKKRPFCFELYFISVHPVNYAAPSAFVKETGPALTEMIQQYKETSKCTVGYSLTTSQSNVLSFFILGYCDAIQQDVILNHKTDI